MRFGALIMTLACIAASAAQFVAMDQLAGVIVMFETEQSITPGMIELRDQYINYVKNELHNTVSQEYTSIFLGFAIRFTDMANIREKVIEHIQLEDGPKPEGINDQMIYDGFYDMLIDYKTRELNEFGVKLLMLPETSVTIYNDFK